MPSGPPSASRRGGRAATGARSTSPRSTELTAPRPDAAGRARGVRGAHRGALGGLLVRAAARGGARSPTRRRSSGRGEAPGRGSGAAAVVSDGGDVVGRERQAARDAGAPARTLIEDGRGGRGRTRKAADRPPMQPAADESGCAATAHDAAAPTRPEEIRTGRRRTSIRRRRQASRRSGAVPDRANRLGALRCAPPSVPAARVWHAVDLPRPASATGVVEGPSRPVISCGSPTGDQSLVGHRAEIAQLVEHATENRGVASSILALGTTDQPVVATFERKWLSW